MNELFIQENYISQDVEHVRVKTVPSGTSQILKKYEWGCKLNDACMYGHVQIKTLLGHVVDEHKGQYANTSLMYEVIFSDLTHDFIYGPYIPVHGFYYHVVDRTLYVQCYKYEPDHPESTKTKMIPYVRVFHILPEEATMHLYAFKSDGRAADDCHFYINHGSIKEVASRCWDWNVGGYMVGKIEGAVQELKTLENTFLIPLIVENGITLKHVGDDQVLRLHLDDRVELEFDPERTKKSFDVDFQYRTDKRTSYAIEIDNIMKRPMILYDNYHGHIDKEHEVQDMLLIHDVVEVKSLR